MLKNTEFKGLSYQLPEATKETLSGLEETMYPYTFAIPKLENKHISKALDCFLNTDETKKKFGHYFIDGPELYYRTVVTNRGQAELAENLIAKKIVRKGKTVHIGNSSTLSLIGRRSAWGNEVVNRNETEVQRTLAQLIPMIPFNVFEEAKLDLDQIQIIERGKAEKVTRLRATGRHDKKGNRIIETETVHFTGGSLFRIGDHYFLFDIDRREIKHKIFNAFLVELPGAVDSISEAYTMLKPTEVLEAEANKLKVQRQGEFFFIPVDSAQAKKLEQHRKSVKSLELRTGNNRPNNGRGVQLYENRAVPDLSWRAKAPETVIEQWNKIKDLDAKSEYYFTGKVTHTGREHAPLMLKGWYRAVPNTAQKSFTIRGEVD